MERDRTDTAMDRPTAFEPVVPTTGRVFLSYRGSDEPYAAILLQLALQQCFGPDIAFRSSESILAGQDFVRTITLALRQCDAVLAVIGPRWLGDADEDGFPRIFDPDDWVYRELASALAQDKLVIPILLAGATLPRAIDLPPGLAALSRCQYRRVSHRQFHHDIALLLRDLGSFLGLSPVEQRDGRPAQIQLDAPVRDRRTPNRGRLR